MYIKLNSSGNILGHDYSSHDDFNTEIQDQVLVHLSGKYLGQYKFKYIDVEHKELQLVEDSEPIEVISVYRDLVELTEEELEVKFQELELEKLQAKTNEESRKLLADTDWYIIRFIDSGVLIPEDIKLARQEARSKIV